jgi:predicted membrane channel-forming protein YqfA (hemolysin III family)
MRRLDHSMIFVVIAGTPKRPDPVSAVLGYHEVFHVLVIAAAALQYAAIAFFVLPGTRVTGHAPLC